jgi:uncharacterized protein YciI
MPYFLYKVIPPRPQFATTLTAAEREIMQSHIAYWKDLTAKGKVVVFGPVADPKGDWGVAIVEADDLAEAERFNAGDPAIQSDHGFTGEIMPMPVAVLRS